MKKSINLWEIWGFGVTVLCGTLLHFLYDWTGESKWSALISGVNESTWEHMKLMFFPMFFFAIVESFFFRDYENFWYIKLRGTLWALSLIPIIFYSYNGIIGKSPDWINISIFFFSAAIAYFYEWKQFKSNEIICKHKKISFAIFCILAFFFVLFTFRTPELNIFKDPITNTYGI